MKLFSDLRQLVFLRRIAIALEQRNAIERERLALEHSHASSRREFKRPSKMGSISVPEVKDWNEAWLKKHPQE